MFASRKCIRKGNFVCTKSILLFDREIERDSPAEIIFCRRTIRKRLRETLFIACEWNLELFVQQMINS